MSNLNQTWDPNAQWQPINVGFIVVTLLGLLGLIIMSVFVILTSIKNNQPNAVLLDIQNSWKSWKLRNWQK